MPSSQRALSRIKNSLITPGRRERTIRSGVFKGLRMHLDLRHHAQNYLGLYERELHAALRELSAGIRCAVDVGSADGSYALYFLARTQAQRVLSFEPDPAARAALHENLALNGFDGSTKLRFVDQAVGDGTAGRLALDDLLAEISLPALVKVDVEGAEVDVLRGADALIRRGHVGWLIETHAESLERECLDILEHHGYQARVIAPAWWRVVVPENRPIPHNRWIVAPALRFQAE
jgi:hypothetical protein